MVVMKLRCPKCNTDNDTRTCSHCGSEIIDDILLEEIPPVHETKDTQIPAVRIEAKRYDAVA